MKACELARIARKTGYRCRAARGGLPGGEIALRLGRAPSTFSRELHRTAPLTTPAATTATWHTIAPGNGSSVRAAVDSRRSLAFARWSRPNWRWSGVQTRSGPGLGADYPDRPVARMPRNDLSGALQRREQWPEQATHQEAAHRTAPAQASPAGTRMHHDQVAALFAGACSSPTRASPGSGRRARTPRRSSPVLP